MPEKHLYDCAIIGGGPAGLVAATYLARLERSVIVLDAGESRAQWIPRCMNAPGFPDGIVGADLLSRLRDQAARYGVHAVSARVHAIEARGDTFTLNAGDTYSARTVLLATGVRNVAPPFLDPPTALRANKLHYCPICDGAETRGHKVAVIGRDGGGLAEAAFLSAFTDDITLIPLTEAVRAEWKDADFPVAGAPTAITLTDDGVEIQDARTRAKFDMIYSCLGLEPVSALARDSGIDVSRTGGILVDRHQRTNRRGIYSAGDVVEGLDQLAVAFGQAAIAAVALHNDLRGVSTADPNTSAQPSAG